MINISSKYTGQPWVRRWRLRTQTFLWQTLRSSSSPPKRTLKPEIWWRFLDAIIALWIHGRAALEAFITALDSFHDTIKFTYDISQVEVTYLDTRTYIKDSRLETDLYIKPTDKHQYLHIGSCHPKHTKSTIPYGQALRLRICSEETNFDKHTGALGQHFQQRGHKSEEVQSAVKRAKAVERQDALQL